MEAGRKKSPRPGPPGELLWDTLDRLLLPLVFSHAAAVLISSLLNGLYISQVSAFTLFTIFVSLTLGVTLFYHNLKVRTIGKSVLVTGSDSVIGSSIVKQLDDMGFTVFAGFPSLNEDSKLLKDSCSGRVHLVELDVTSDQSIHAALSYVLSRLPDRSPGLWAVINAACMPAYGEVEWIPFSIFRKSTEINLLGTIRVTQVFLPLIRNNKGRIINLASIQGRICSSMHSPLCVAKSGVESFSDCLRLEMRRWGVDVVVIEPGHLSTSTWFESKQMTEDAKIMWENLSEQARQEYGKDYFEYKVRAMNEFKSDPEWDVSCVIKCVSDAVTRTFPLSRYTPVTRQEKIQSLISHHFPRSVYDIIYHK